MCEGRLVTSYSETVLLRCRRSAGLCSPAVARYPAARLITRAQCVAATPLLPGGGGRTRGTPPKGCLRGALGGLVVATSPRIASALLLASSLVSTELFLGTFLEHHNGQAGRSGSEQTAQHACVGAI